MILPLLGSEVKATTLPARVRCPLCSNNILQVYKDVLDRSQWYCCPKCRFQGDAIELAAKFWRISHVSAVLKLRSAGVKFPADTDESTIQLYVQNHIKYREKINAFWQSCSANQTPLDGGLAAFGRKLGIPSVRPRDWASRGGQFVGISDRLAVIRCFQPALATENSKHGEQGGQRMFKGKGWGQVIVIPCHLLPGRLRGFILVGREAKYPEDYLYRPLASVSNTRGDAVTDHGIAMLSTIIQPQQQFDNMTFACTDMAEAIRLQLAYLVDHTTPLPLVGTWGDKPSVVWETLPPHPRTVFGPDTDPGDVARLIRLAQKTNSQIGKPIVGKPSRPIDVIKTAMRNTASWQGRLEAEMTTRQSCDAEDLFLRVDLAKGDRVRFLQDCQPDVQEKIRGLTDLTDNVLSIDVGKVTVIESDGVWKNAKTGALISDVIIHVDRVIHQRKQGRIIFEGFLTRRGKDCSFRVDQSVVDAAPGNWLSRTCLINGLGTVNTLDRRWIDKLFQMAQLFREPVFVETDGVFGWHEDKNAFAFPRFTIAMGGTVASQIEDAAAGTPSLCFDFPDGLAPAAVVSLSHENDSTRLFWAVIATFAASAVSPSLGLEPSSIGFCGSGARHVLNPVATALGCHLITSGNAGITATRVAAVRQSEVWPIVICPLNHRTHYLEITNLPAGTVCPVTPWTAISLAMLGGWTIVETPLTASTLPINTHGSAVLVNYLRHFCANRVYTGGDNLVEVILEDMATWFESRQGNPRTVRRAKSVIRTDDGDHFSGRFAGLICRVYSDGSLPIIRADVGELPSKKLSLTVLPDGLLHIPRAAIVQTMSRHEAPQLDAAIVTRRLAADGILVDEREHGDHVGWVVREQWWGQYFQRWRARNQTSLKKVN